MTAGVQPLISLVTIPSRLRIMCAAMLIGSMPFSGVDPWQPFPRTVIANRSKEAMTGPGEIRKVPVGISLPASVPICVKNDLWGGL